MFSAGAQEASAAKTSLDQRDADFTSSRQAA